MTIDVQEILNEKIDTLGKKIDTLQANSAEQTGLLKTINQQYEAVKADVHGSKKNFTALEKQVNELEDQVKPIIKKFNEEDSFWKDMKRKGGYIILGGLAGFIIEHLKAILHFIY